MPSANEPKFFSNNKIINKSPFLPDGALSCSPIFLLPARCVSTSALYCPKLLQVGQPWCHGASHICALLDTVFVFTLFNASSCGKTVPI